MYFKQKILNTIYHVYISSRHTANGTVASFRCLDVYLKISQQLSYSLWSWKGLKNIIKNSHCYGFWCIHLEWAEELHKKTKIIGHIFKYQVCECISVKSVQKHAPVSAEANCLVMCKIVFAQILYALRIIGLKGNRLII